MTKHVTRSCHVLKSSFTYQKLTVSTALSWTVDIDWIHPCIKLDWIGLGAGPPGIPSRNWNSPHPPSTKIP